MLQGFLFRGCCATAAGKSSKKLLEALTVLAETSLVVVHLQDEDEDEDEKKSISMLRDEFGIILKRIVKEFRGKKKLRGRYKKLQDSLKKVVTFTPCVVKF